MSGGLALWCWAIIAANAGMAIDDLMHGRWYALPDCAFFAGWMGCLLWKQHTK